MVDLIDLIQQDVTLTKRGKDYFGLCPFHREKTPSFSVSPESQLYYCFGCGVGGDAISWLRSYRKLSYQEACRVVGKELEPRVLPSRRTTQAEADTTLDYFIWEHAERRRWTDTHRALLADLEEAEVGVRATRRCPELYTGEQQAYWLWRLVAVKAELEESAFIPTMADIFTYDEHRQERFLLWQKERDGGA